MYCYRRAVPPRGVGQPAVSNSLPPEDLPYVIVRRISGFHLIIDDNIMNMIFYLEESIYSIKEDDRATQSVVYEAGEDLVSRVPYIVCCCCNNFPSPCLF